MVVHKLGSPDTELSEAFKPQKNYEVSRLKILSCLLSMSLDCNRGVISLVLPSAVLDWRDWLIAVIYKTGN